MSNEQQSHLAVLDQCVITGFYCAIVGAVGSFAPTLFLRSADAETYLATAWICVFAAAVCLLLRLGVLAWDDGVEAAPALESSPPGPPLR